MKYLCRESALLSPNSLEIYVNILKVDQMMTLEAFTYFILLEEGESLITVIDSLRDSETTRSGLWYSCAEPKCGVVI